MSNGNTKDQILKIARDLLATDGLSAVSFDAIAARLGRTKQAVLYWYPSKHDLLSAMFLPSLEAEATAATRSVAGATSRDQAIEAFVRSVAAFHLQDLDRFRMMYLLPQTIKPSAGEPYSVGLLAKVHPVTDRMYAALAENLTGDPKGAREQALAIHAAVLGLVLMCGLAESVKDPLTHSVSDLVEALITSFTTA